MRESSPLMAVILLFCRLSVTSRVREDTVLMCTRLLEHTESWGRRGGGERGGGVREKERGGEGKEEGE